MIWLTNHAFAWYMYVERKSCTFLPSTQSAMKLLIFRYSCAQHEHNLWVSHTSPDAVKLHPLWDLHRVGQQLWHSGSQDFFVVNSGVSASTLPLRRVDSQSMLWACEEALTVTELSQLELKPLAGNRTFDRTLGRTFWSSRKSVKLDLETQVLYEKAENFQLHPLTGWTERFQLFSIQPLFGSDYNLEPLFYLEEHEASVSLCIRICLMRMGLTPCDLGDQAQSPWTSRLPYKLLLCAPWTLTTDGPKLALFHSPGASPQPRSWRSHADSITFVRLFHPVKKDWITQYFLALLMSDHANKR